MSMTDDKIDDAMRDTFAFMAKRAAKPDGTVEIDDLNFITMSLAACVVRWTSEQLKQPDNKFLGSVFVAGFLHEIGVEELPEDTKAYIDRIWLETVKPEGST